VFRENSQQVRANLKDYFVMFDLQISRTTSFGTTEADWSKKPSYHGDGRRARLTLSDAFTPHAARRLHRMLVPAAETASERSIVCSPLHLWTSRSSVPGIRRLLHNNRIPRRRLSTSKRTPIGRLSTTTTTCCGPCELHPMAARL
jgi:hypothetical protein